MPRNIVRRLNTDQTSGFRARPIFPVQIVKSSYFCIYCADMLKTFQGETKLLEFSRDTNREEIGKKNRRLFCSGFVQWLHCNGFVATASASLVAHCLQVKQPSLPSLPIGPSLRPSKPLKCNISYIDFFTGQ